MKRVLIIIAAMLAGCAMPIRIDQVPVRELRSGTAIELSVITDPIRNVTCYKAAGFGLWCEHSK